MASSRPAHTRTASTNLVGAVGNRPLEGKLGIVTGASRGIGVGVAQNLASKGCSLILSYTSDSSTKATEELAQTLQSEHGIQTLCVQADLALPTGPSHIINTAKNHFSHPKTGKFQLDIVVNNAGVTHDQPLPEIEIDTFTWMYKINVLAPLLLVQAATPYLPNDRSGRIVNMSSVSSTMGFEHQTCYGGTKAALEAMTRTWARELAERATVNAVTPGPVLTDMWEAVPQRFKEAMAPIMKNIPLAKVRPGVDTEELVRDAEKAGGRPAYVEEIGGIVGMLCTPDASWCTGQAICANGGMRFQI